jgi:hypothetical protein
VRKERKKVWFLWGEEEGDFKYRSFVFENCECKWRNNNSKLHLQPGVFGAWNWRSSEFPVLLRYCHFFLTQEKQTSRNSNSEYDDFCTLIANLCKGNKWWGSNLWHCGAYGGWGGGIDGSRLHWGQDSGSNIPRSVQWYHRAHGSCAAGIRSCRSLLQTTAGCFLEETRSYSSGSPSMFSLLPCVHR